VDIGDHIGIGLIPCLDMGDPKMGAYLANPGLIAPRGCGHPEDQGFFCLFEILFCKMGISIIPTARWHSSTIRRETSERV
jgi:hypothetical protein